MNTDNNDTYYLQRFLDLQRQDYATALREIKNGLKVSHWIWYVFPQLKILGRSFTARHFGISGADEAKAYWENETLRKRLVEISEALLKYAGVKSAVEILGPIDAAKVRSCMTLFGLISGFEGDGEVFRRVLDGFYDGEMCLTTVSNLGIR